MGRLVTSLADRIALHGQVAKITVVATKGSVPREVGTSMIVWADGQEDTIGGGTLEFAATAAARSRLGGTTGASLSHHALGPDMGQCCGGAVSLVTEILCRAPNDMRAVPLIGTDGDQPLSVARVKAAMRNGTDTRRVAIVDGWFIENTLPAPRDLWIWGAGHVGRALVQVLHPLPELSLTWVDTDPSRFPDHVPREVTVAPAQRPERLTAHAPRSAHHLLLTYSHDLDLALCHGLLNQGFETCGLIGSKTKWARFRSRLAHLGHRPEEISRITCPIGDPSLGKHPTAIAIGVAARLMSVWDKRDSRGTLGEQRLADN